MLVSFLYSLLGTHRCRQAPVPAADRNTEPLSPVILLPGAGTAGISYEALHYPVPADQYELIPLVINTGKIPFVNHAVLAPIQYFIPNSENQRMSNYDPFQQHSASSEQIPITYSNSRLIENQRTDKHYTPTTIYSETHVEGRSSAPYSYGYEIIDGQVGDDRPRELRGDGGYSLPELDRTRRIYPYTTNQNRQGAKSRAVDRKLYRAGREDGGDLPFRALKPIIVRPDTKTELKKHYKNTTNLETSTNKLNLQNSVSSTT